MSVAPLGASQESYIAASKIIGVSVCRGGVWLKLVKGVVLGAIWEYLHEQTGRVIARRSCLLECYCAGRSREGPEVVLY